jgi:1-acyl-sn-glycerol-3-phosphate acyltransferase
VRLLRGPRSGLAFVLNMLLVLGAELYERFVVWPLIQLSPGRRDALMWPLMRFLSHSILRLIRMGGASARRVGSVPDDQPALVLMNHQSLIDIPVLYTCFDRLPIVVTRRRYGRGIPMVSLMLRILDYPLVDPDDDPRGAVALLRKAARQEAYSLLLFPEGHRSRDGEIGAFETAGVRVVLGQKRRPVYLIVTDGYWKCRRLVDFALNLHRIRGETSVLGPFEPPGSAAEIPAFAEHLREVMIAHLHHERLARASLEGSRFG